MVSKLCALLAAEIRSHSSDSETVGTERLYSMVPAPFSDVASETNSANAASIRPGKKRKSTTVSPTPLKMVRISETGPIPKELTCRICSGVFVEPSVTPCGHTFCRSCLEEYVSRHAKCPYCQVGLIEGKAVRNSAICELVSALRDSESDAGTSGCGKSTSDRSMLLKDILNLKLGDFEAVSLALRKRKDFLTSGANPSQNAELTLEFLGELKRVKLQNKLNIERQLEILNSDLECLKKVPSVEKDYAQQIPCDIGSETDEDRNSLEFISAKDEPKYLEISEMLKSHFDDLCSAYWKLRDPGIIDINHNAVSDSQQESLEVFENIVDQVSSCQKLNKIASIHYSVDLYRRPCLVCTVDFDRDGEYFAAAGSAKYIRLYQYDSVITNPIGASCPVGEFWCGSTVSRVSWNGYFKNSLVSSNYDGIVNTWDAATLSSVRSIKGHQKKIWSVKWSKGDPRIFASASDDASVRVWSSVSQKPPLVVSLQSSACDVDFSPEDAYTVSIACADRNMYLYDLRNPRVPTNTFKGHSRTVSGARFTSKDELMTSSIDSQILLWKKDNEEPVRTFKGHKNEKNFIGLASHGDFIAAGSEDDKVYIYHKAIQKPLASFQFEDQERILDGPMCGSSAGFVSAIAWKNSSVLLAANSWGTINVLQME